MNLTKSRLTALLLVLATIVAVSPLVHVINIGSDQANCII